MNGRITHYFNSHEMRLQKLLFFRGTLKVRQISTKIIEVCYLLLIIIMLVFIVDCNHGNYRHLLSSSLQ